MYGWNESSAGFGRGSGWERRDRSLGQGEMHNALVVGKLVIIRLSSWALRMACAPYTALLVVSLSF